MGSALELGRLFSLMETGVDPELFNAALLRAAGGGGDLGAAQGSLPPGFSLPPGMSLPPGLEGLLPPQLDDGGGGNANKSGGSGGMEGGATTDSEDEDRGSVGAANGANPPPRTGSINDRKCTKVLPASSSAPKYKFVVPNEYVYKFMKHLVERPFHMRDMGGKLWDCVLIQRKNKEKYEYMIQGWRRFGEATGVQEGDTVTIEMVSDSVLQLTLERTGSGGAGSKKRARTSGAAENGKAYGEGGGGPQRELLGQGGLLGDYFGGQQANGSGDHHHHHHSGQRGGDDRELEHANGLLVPPSRTPPASQQGAPGPAFGPGMGDGGGPGGGTSQQLLELIQQHQQQAAAQHQGLHAQAGTPQPTLTPRSLTQHLANGLGGGALGGGGGPGGGGINEAQLADLTAIVSQLEKRQRLVGDGPPGGANGTALGGGAAGAGAIRLLSDVADIENLMHQNGMLREELRMAQAKIATLETGVLNIKSVLTRNTDPGLIAMTGVINLLNQMESTEFLPELGTLGRMTLTGLCSEVRRHLNGVLRMVWILRSLPDDVQQHNSGPGGGPPGANSGPP